MNNVDLAAAFNSLPSNGKGSKTPGAVKPDPTTTSALSPGLSRAASGKPATLQ
jgi:hypothetical protein